MRAPTTHTAPIYLRKDLGFVSKSKRTIKPGTQYNRFFGKAQYQDPIINKGATTMQTVDDLKQIVLECLPQTASLARHLQAASIEQTCRNNFNFIYDHIAYELDSSKVEQLREPNRLWADKKGDCDCYALTLSTLLYNQGIPHYFRVVKMYGNSHYQHIYVVVPKSPTANLGANYTSNLGNRADYIVIDPVLDNFNEEPKKITLKTDIAMIPVQRLNGVEPQRAPSATAIHDAAIQRCIFGQEFAGMGSYARSLGCACNSQQAQEAGFKEVNDRLKQHFKNSIAEAKKIAAHNPKVIPVAAKIERVLSVWDNEDQRLKALIEAARSSKTCTEQKFYTLAAISTVVEQQGVAGLKGFGDWWERNVSVPATKFWTNTRQAFNEAWDALKDIAKNVAEKLKKFGEWFLKWNPVSFLTRIGVLTLISKNAFKLADDATPYYRHPTWAAAKAAGIPWSIWEKARRTWQSMDKWVVQVFKGSPAQLQAAVIERKLIIEKTGEADLLAIEQAFSYNKPMLMAQILNNIYGETTAERTSPTSLIVTDVIGAKGYVVLVSGIPSIELVAVHVDGDGMARGFNTDGQYFKSNNGGWFPVTDKSPIWPFPAEEAIFFKRLENGDVNPAQTFINSADWATKQRILFFNAKAKLSQTSLFERAASSTNLAPQNPGGTMSPGTSSPGGGGGGLLNLGGLGAIAETTISAAILLGAAIVKLINDERNNKAAEKEPTSDQDENPDEGQNPGGNNPGGNNEGDSSTKNMLIVGGIGLAILAAFMLSADDKPKKSLGCPAPVQETAPEPMPLNGPKRVRKPASRAGSTGRNKKKHIHVKI